MIRKMNIIRSAKIALLITVLMMIASVLISIINDLIFSNTFSFLNNVIDFMIAMLGHGGINTSSKIITLLTGFAGIIFISFLSAYLTMNLFMREKIFIYDKIVLWRRGSEILASIIIVNTEGDIDDVDVSFAVFLNKKVLCTSNMNENIIIPYIPKKGYWKIDCPIVPNSFMHNALKKVDKYGWVMFFSVKYTDIFTGQQFTTVSKYNLDNIIGSEDKAGIAYNGKSRCIKKNIIVEQNDICRMLILSQIKDNVLKIDNGLATKIGYPTRIQAMTYPARNRQSVTAYIDWRQRNGDDFGMVCYKLTPCQDWTDFYRKNAKLNFDLRTNHNVRSVTLEIKKAGSLSGIIEKALYSNSDGYEEQSVLLKENPDINNFKEIIEICFLIRGSQIIDKEQIAEFEIVDLQLHYENDD